MTRPQVMKVDRDDGGITYSGEVETPAAQAEKPIPAPIEIKSREDAEALGLEFGIEREEQMEHVRGDIYCKTPAHYSAEWSGSFRGNPPRSYHFYAPSLEKLLADFEAFLRRDSE